MLPDGGIAASLPIDKVIGGNVVNAMVMKHPKN
jgi:hypothetical protein